MVTVMIVPTGLGCEVGGHAGDALPVAKMLAGVSDILITHPNVLNASDINDMTENTLYVEGSMLDRFLDGTIELKRVPINKILLVVNEITNDIQNVANTARTTLGADITIMKLDTPLEMNGFLNENGTAGGTVTGWEELIKQVNRVEFDALAVLTRIKVPNRVCLNYLNNGGVNPWGGVERLASRFISQGLEKPVAHAPIGQGVLENYRELVDPRMAAELISLTYSQCIFKGLLRAPRIGKGLSVEEVGCLVSPVGCIGDAHWGCHKHNIPIIFVKENTCCLDEEIPEEFENYIEVDNYLEAAGVIACMNAGVYYKTVRRPLEKIEIINKYPGTSDGKSSVITAMTTVESPGSK